MNSYMLSYLMHPIWLYIFFNWLDMPIIGILFLNKFPPWILTNLSLLILLAGMSLSRGISDLNILLNLLYNLKHERQKDKTINLIIQPFFVKETFTGWISKENKLNLLCAIINFPNWLEYLKVAIPVGSVVYLEWAFYEVTTIIVGMLQDDDQLAGHTSF